MRATSGRARPLVNFNARQHPGAGGSHGVESTESRPPQKEFSPPSLVESVRKSQRLDRMGAASPGRHRTRPHLRFDGPAEYGSRVVMNWALANAVGGSLQRLVPGESPVTSSLPSSRRSTPRSRSTHALLSVRRR